MGRWITVDNSSRTLLPTGLCMTCPTPPSPLLFLPLLLPPSLSPLPSPSPPFPSPPPPSSPSSLFPLSSSLCLSLTASSLFFQHTRRGPVSGPSYGLCPGPGRPHVTPSSPVLLGSLPKTLVTPAHLKWHTQPSGASVPLSLPPCLHPADRAFLAASRGACDSSVCVCHVPGPCAGAELAGSPPESQCWP